MAKRWVWQRDLVLSVGLQDTLFCLAQVCGIVHAAAGEASVTCSTSSAPRSYSSTERVFAQVAEAMGAVNQHAARGVEAIGNALGLDLVRRSNAGAETGSESNQLAQRSC